MKSTVKIDYQVRGNGGVSVIKIVQPIEIFKQSPEADIDPRDTMVNQFLKSEQNLNHNRLFSRSTYYPYPFENPTHYITNIEPISDEVLLYRLEGLLTNVIEEWKLDFDKESIKNFFDSINKSVEEKNKEILMTPQ